MSDDNQPTKQKRYAEKRKSRKINFDMYLSDPVENQVYESWQEEPNKKQLFIKMYIEHLAREQKNENH